MPQDDYRLVNIGILCLSGLAAGLWLIAINKKLKPNPRYQKVFEISTPEECMQDLVCRCTLGIYLYIPNLIKIDEELAVQDRFQF